MSSTETKLANMLSPKSNMFPLKSKLAWDYQTWFIKEQSFIKDWPVGPTESSIFAKSF